MSTSALVRQLYDAFNARDLDTLLDSLHPDVDWPNGWEGGRIAGREGVRDYWTRQWAAMDPHVTPVSITAHGDNRVTVRVRQVVRDLAGNITSMETSSTSIHLTAT